MTPRPHVFGDLTGRTALVTGAGRGIGAGVAASLAEAGADVLVNAYTPGFVHPLTARLASRTGRRVEPLVGDATTPDGVAAMVDDVILRFGGLDILVNGVGDAVLGSLADLGSGPVAMTDADIERVLALNLTSVVLASRAAAPALARSTHGVVLTISGAAAARGGAGMVVYAAAKTAITGLTRALALEWAPAGIRVNAIAPGIVPDPDRPQFDAETGARFAAQIPLGALGTPDQIGRVARFLVSDDAAYLTGQTIHVDGGFTL